MLRMRAVPGLLLSMGLVAACGPVPPSEDSDGSGGRKSSGGSKGSGGSKASGGSGLGGEGAGGSGAGGSGAGGSGAGGSGAGGSGGGFATECLNIDGPGTAVAGTVTGDEVWAAADGPFIIESGTIIEGNVIIEPCTAVLLGKGAYIDVRGSLTAQGAAEEQEVGDPILYPVAFAPLVEGERWGTIEVEPNALLDLQVTAIEGGGATEATIHAYGDDQYGLPHRNVRAVIVAISDSEGPAYLSESRAGFTEDSEGLSIEGAGQGDVPYPLVIDGGTVGTLPGSLTLTGNGADEIFVYPFRPVHNDHFKALGYPYVINGPLTVATGNSGTESGQSELVIDPGVTMRMGEAAGSGLYVGNGSGKEGILIAEGTADAPIRFESAKASPAPGDWVGIYFDEPVVAGNSLKYVTIAHAGANNGTNGYGCGPGENDASLLILGEPDASFIENCTIEDAGGDTQILLGWDYGGDPAGSAQAILDANTFDSSGPACQVSLPQDSISKCPGDDFEPDCL